MLKDRRLLRMVFSANASLFAFAGLSLGGIAYVLTKLGGAVIVANAITALSVFALMATLSMAVAMKGSKDVRAITAIAVWSACIAVYGFEIVLAVNPERSLFRFLNAGLDPSFDLRSISEVVDDLAAKGTDRVVPVVYPSYVLGSRDGLLIADRTVQPLGGVSRSPTVYCNETGVWRRFHSDIHGFRNPDAVWRDSLDIAAVGDSFTMGACVTIEDSFIGRIRAIYPKTLNLAYSGNGPLMEIAALQEYLPSRRPKIVIWAYFEGNDLENLFYENANSSILQRYLADPAFNQNLTAVQTEVDAALRQWLRHKRSTKSNETKHNFWRSVVNVLLLRNIRESFGLSLQTLETQPIDDATLTLFEHILQHANDRVSSWGGRLVFVYLPEISRFTRTRTPSVYRERVLAAAQQSGISIIDVVESFAAHPDPPSLWQDANVYNHFTPDGNAIVAAMILDTVTPWLRN